MTLEQAASRVGLTRSWLSKVENFRVTPSLPALHRIAEAYGVSLVELLEGLDHKPDLVVIRKEERQEVKRDTQDPNIAYHSLAHKRANRNMDPFTIQIPPGMGREELLSHEGEEFLIVQEGQVTFEYGDEQVLLEEGDCIYFDGKTPHRLVNPGDEPTQVLTVFLNTKLNLNREGG